GTRGQAREQDRGRRRQGQGGGRHCARRREAAPGRQEGPEEVLAQGRRREHQGRLQKV
ncbi:MAG: hypothetical protein AVDCRST_MAG21-747, partial [uncultured Nocardioidaceae bacterium]